MTHEWRAVAPPSHASLLEDNMEHICKQCGKSFGSYRGMNSHQYVHKPKKDFPCTHCGKVFTHWLTLGQHVKNTHIPKVPKPVPVDQPQLVEVYVRVPLTINDHVYEGKVFVSPDLAAALRYMEAQHFAAEQRLFQSADYGNKELAHIRG